MLNEEKHLETKIRMFEDMMLRCKNHGQTEVIRKELEKMRRRKQKLYFERIGS